MSTDQESFASQWLEKAIAEVQANSAVALSKDDAMALMGVARLTDLQEFKDQLVALITANDHFDSVIDKQVAEASCVLGKFWEGPFEVDEEDLFNVVITARQWCAWNRAQFPASDLLSKHRRPRPA